MEWSKWNTIVVGIFSFKYDLNSEKQQTNHYALPFPNVQANQSESKVSVLEPALEE